jgi:hypothetical protein
MKAVILLTLGLLTSTSLEAATTAVGKKTCLNALSQDQMLRLSRGVELTESGFSYAAAVKDKNTVTGLKDMLRKGKRLYPNAKLDPKLTEKAAGDVCVYSADARDTGIGRLIAKKRTISLLVKPAPKGRVTQEPKVQQVKEQEKGNVGQTNHELHTQHEELKKKHQELESKYQELLMAKTGQVEKKSYAGLSKEELMKLQEESDAKINKEYQDLYQQFAEGKVAPKDERILTQKLEFLEKQLDKPITERRTFEEYLQEEEEKKQKEILAAQLLAEKKKKAESANREKLEKQMSEDKEIYHNLRQEFNSLSEAEQNAAARAYSKEPLWKMLYLAQPGQEKEFDVKGPFGKIYQTPFINNQYLRAFSLEELRALRTFISTLDPLKANYHLENINNRISALMKDKKQQQLFAEGSIKRALKKVSPEDLKKLGSMTSKKDSSMKTPPPPPPPGNLPPPPPPPPGDFGKVSKEQKSSKQETSETSSGGPAFLQELLKKRKRID